MSGATEPTTGTPRRQLRREDACIWSMQVAIARAAFGGRIRRCRLGPGFRGWLRLPAERRPAHSPRFAMSSVSRAHLAGREPAKDGHLLSLVHPVGRRELLSERQRRHLPRPHALSKRSLSSPLLRLSCHRSRSRYPGADGDQRSARLGRGTDRSNVGTDRSRRRGRCDRRRDSPIRAPATIPRPTLSAGLPRPRADRGAKWRCAAVRCRQAHRRLRRRHRPRRPSRAAAPASSARSAEHATRRPPPTNARTLESPFAAPMCKSTAGAPVHIAGKVDADGTGCALVRVDVAASRPVDQSQLVARR